MTKEQIEKLNKEYKELSTVFGSLSEKFKEIKGQPLDEKGNILVNDMMDNINAQIRYVHQRLDYLSNDLHNHFDAHLPKLTAGQLEKLLKAAGASDDFEVRKKVIYASVKSNNRNPVIEVAYSPPKTA